MKGDKSDNRWSEPKPAESLDYSPGPASAAAYIPPTQVPKESKYHTLDLKAVRLSPEIDPKRMKTQMALRRLPAPSELGPSPTTWVASCLAGAALGLAAWWCLQWWRDQDMRTTGLVGRDAVAQGPVTQASFAAQPSIVLAPPPALPLSIKPSAATSTHAPPIVPTGSQVISPARSVTPSRTATRRRPNAE